jgi:hypothetical protein
MQKNGKRFLATLAFLIPISVIAACAAGYLYRAAQNTSVPRLVKLTNCTNQIVAAVFRAPKGMLFHLVLGGASEFSGSGVVHVGTNKVQEFQFDDATATRCNWLDDKGYPNARILNWNAEPRLNLAAGSSAVIKVSFEKMPPTNATLWISFVQRYGDMKKESAGANAFRWDLFRVK